MFPVRKHWTYPFRMPVRYHFCEPPKASRVDHPWTGGGAPSRPSSQSGEIEELSGGDRARGLDPRLSELTGGDEASGLDPRHGKKVGVMTRWIPSQGGPGEGENIVDPSQGGPGGGGNVDPPQSAEWVVKKAKSKKSKAAPPQPTKEVVISGNPLGDVEMEAATSNRSWAEESPDRSPKKKMMSLLSDFSLEGALDNSGFIPTRAQRDEEEDEDVEL